MGMFDSVYTRCPQCGKDEVEFQSKAGDCMLAHYTLYTVPAPILADIVSSIGHCHACGYMATATLIAPPIVEIT